MYLLVNRIISVLLGLTDRFLSVNHLFNLTLADYKQPRLPADELFSDFGVEDADRWTVAFGTVQKYIHNKWNKFCVSEWVDS